MLRIKEIWIKNDRQFKDFYLDLGDLPDDGRDICFIGSNGTGKSTLLRMIKTHLETGQTVAEVAFQNEFTYFQRRDAQEERALIINCEGKNHAYIQQDEHGAVRIAKDLNSIKSLNRPNPILTPPPSYSPDRTLSATKGVENARIAYCPPEDDPKANGKIPTVSEALELLKRPSLVHEIGNRSITGFWKQLTFAIVQRDKAFKAFMKHPENEDLSLKAANEAFDQQFPDVLQGLAEKWTALLDQAGLKLDTQGAKLPVQLTEKLEANLQLANGNPLPYEDLSTGIRMYLYRIGYLYSLFFRNDVENSLLLLDEPETSLFPDFVYGLLATYRAAVNKDTQIIAATHDPIFAAQFHPECRFILEFNDDGYVTARPGVSPRGDDPNDLLRRDFGMRTVYGKDGLDAWRRYLQIRQKLGEDIGEGERVTLAKEYMTLGTQYNFPEGDEISSEG